MNLNPYMRSAGVTLALALSMAMFSRPAAGLIVQPGSPGETLPTDLPVDAIGKWGNNAAAVAVAPGWVLTTRHQDSLTNPPDRNVLIDGVTYLADTDAQVTFGSNIDLRLVPIFNNGQAATLSSYVEVYTGSVSPPTTSVIVGFGPTIGAADTDGFDWAGSLNANNGLNIGQNRIDSTDTIDSGTYSGMSVLKADFDNASAFGAVEFEATGSFGDSGGSWFINDGGTWKITGLTHSVELDGDDDGVASTTSNDHAAQAFFGQELLAVDLRDFASILLIAGDYNRNGTVDAADYTVWQDSFGSTVNLAADGNGNGIVDAADYTVWQDNFGATFGATSSSSITIPEPGMACLVIPALVWGLNRRR